jgi:hypothetical protein
MDQNKLQTFCELLQQQQIERLNRDDLSCDVNVCRCKVTSRHGKKYTKVDIGTSGKYMIENDTEKIYGIKAYGVIHRGHYYGTLDTINDWWWGDYTAYPKQKDGENGISEKK